MKTNCEFVWLFGTSAVGKNTFINKLKNNEALRNRFALNNVVVCQESLKLVGDKCPTNDTRNILIEVISKMPKDNKSVLIKGQSVDLYDNKLHEKLKESYPSGIHKIILLWVEPSELVRRWQKRAIENPGWRDWGDGSNALERCTNAQNEQLKTIRALENSFEVIYINSTDEEYRSLDVNLV